MADQLRLRVVLEMAERVLAPMKRISGASGETARALKAARDRLKELNDQQGAVGNVQKHAAELARLNNALKVKQALLDGMRASGTATVAQIKREERGVRTLADALEVQKSAAVKARAALNAMGISGNLSAAQARLKTDIDGATAAMGKQRAELQRLAAQQRQLQDLRDKHNKAMLHAGVAAGAGVALQAAGRRGVQMGMGPVANYSKHEDAMLGIARQVPGARNEMGQLTEVYRQAERDVRALSGQIPLTTTEITNMMTASARMEVPTDKLKEFTLMASEMATAFDAVPDEITERMGKVAKTFNIPLTEIRGLADSINFLDDNAISKGADIIDFMTRVSGVAALAKMDPRDYAALGSTLLTLGERTETAGTATNSIVQTLAAATKGTKGFRSAMAELGLSTSEVEKGMTKDAMGTIKMVLEAINALPEEKRLGVMVELVGKEHSDTLAKLAANPKELARQRALATGDNAKGSMAREAAARNAALSAQWQMTKNRAFNLSATVGETLAPTLLKLLKVVNPLIEGFMRFVQNHSTLVGWVLGAVVAFSALTAGVGFLLVPLALIAGKVMLLRFVFARFALTAGGPLAAGLRVAGQAAMVFVRGGLLAMLAAGGPAIAVVAAIAAAALLIYRYWGPIKAFLGGVWEGLRNGLTPVLSQMAPLVQFGSMLVGWLGQAWTWFTELIAPIKSTQEELAGFASAGQLVGEVLGGIVAKLIQVANYVPVLGLLARVSSLIGGQGSPGAAAGLGLPGGLPVMPATTGPGALRFFEEPKPLKFNPRGEGGNNTTTNNITVNAAPGMDEKAMAQAISFEMDRRERAKKSSVRSQLSDLD
ncbi:phage tail tape measure protein [Acidovorax radicis]|uniref:phage tail tape measure protein n=1 Tax=Acidovorax radicis TaxID=758826 RepID=UPI0002F6AE9A|nr:phage tail tape measure protein [Acidovorax radicis]